MKAVSRETVERAVRMYPNGTAAGRALGVSWLTLRTWCLRYGIELPNSRSRRKQDVGAESDAGAQGRAQGKERRRGNFGRRICRRKWS